MSDSVGRLSAALADRYRIERELGQGGMATVYLAQDLRHDRKVAIKVLRAELAAVIGADRFLTEIKTTANLQHPHILPLFDSGQAGGGGDGQTFLFYVMPYIEGETVRDRLNREKQLPVGDAVRIATEVASALDYAHRHGVIHRDIKPENILLHDGRVIVADFGIALAASKAGNTRMTETGMSLGTPHYMSPEQAMGEREIGPPSDVYALGAVTYEMLVGEPPFTGPTAQSIVARVVTEEPRPLTPRRHTIPPHVEGAVLTALEKLPADRFATTKDFADALASPHYTRPTAAGLRPLHSSTSGRWKIVAAAVSLVALVATVMAVRGWRRADPRPAVARYTLAFPDSQYPVIGTLSRDGQRFLYEGPGNNGDRLWVKERDRFDATPIPGTDNPSGFALSPDGRWAAVVQNGVLRKVPLAGGAPIKLAEPVFFGGVTWLDDGTLVFSTNTFVLSSVSEAGGAMRELWTPPNPTVPAMMMPLPDSRGVFFTLCNMDCTNSSLYVYEFKSDSARQLIPDVLYGFYLSTGHLAYVDRQGFMYGVPFDLDRLEIRGDAIPLVNGISLVIGIVPTVTVSGTGTLIMQTASGSNVVAGAAELVWVDRAGIRTPVDSGWTFRSSNPSGNNGWSLSPDGTKVAIALTTNSGEDIWIKDLSSGALSRLTFDSTAQNRPRWTADGRSVTYIEFGRDALMEQRGDGTGTAQVIMKMNRPLLEGLRSRDGTWLVGRAGGRVGQGGGRDIVAMHIGVDSAARPLVADPSADETAPALSPDGRWLAYTSDETGTSEVYLRPFPNTEGGKWQVSNSGGQAPLWARSGRELFYVDAGRNMIAVSVAGGISPGLGGHRRLFSLGQDLYLGDPEFYTPFDISPDDRRFLMVRQVRAGSQGRPGEFVVIENWFEELKQRMAGSGR